MHPSIDDIAHELNSIAGLRPEQIEPSSRLIEDLDLDSLDVAELMMWVSTSFDVQNIEDQLETLRWEGMTVQDLSRVVEALSNRPK